LLLRQRTQLINAVRGHLAEFGLIARRGAHNIRELRVCTQNGFGSQDLF
jgi:transposase